MLNLALSPFYIPLEFGQVPMMNRELVRQIFFTIMSDVERDAVNDHQPQLHSGSSMAWRFFEHCGYCTDWTWSFFLETLIHPHRLNSVHLRNC